MVDTLGDLTSALQTYVVSPLNAFGLGGFLFDVQTEGTATLSADITDHYTEDNKAVQDHIAIKPKRITLKGYVGELLYNTSSQSTEILQVLTQKLTTISAYLPQMSAAATQAQGAISGINSSGGTLESFSAGLPAAANIYGLIKNAIGAFGNTAKQQAAYQYFSSCQSEKILMGIQTPWEFLTNMAVETIVAIQPEESIFMTDFSVTFKQMRFATTKTAAAKLSGTGGSVPPGGPLSQGAAIAQGQPATNLGSNPSAPLPDPSLPGVQGSIISMANVANSGLSNIFHFTPAGP